MDKFEKNIKNTFGQAGCDWLKHLPAIVDTLSIQWSLSYLQPVTNMNWHYVAKALQHDTSPVVLKIGCDAELIQNEYRALKLFNGHGAISTFEFNKKYNALLLQQAIPGIALKDYSPRGSENTVKIYTQVIEKLASIPFVNKDGFTHISQWLKAIDDIADPRIDKRFIEKARSLRAYLSNATAHEYLCHGDLHLENILQNDSRWIAIDPKGIIGEMAFEASAFDLLSENEMKTNQDMSSLISTRISTLSKLLALDYDCLLAWIFLRTIVSAQWFIEDKGDPSQALRLAKWVYDLFE